MLWRMRAALPDRPGTLAALAQPTRYVNAARAVLAQPSSFPDIAAHLFDADVVPGGRPRGRDGDDAGRGRGVQIRRATPFTDTERARGAALAELVAEVLERQTPPPTGVQPGGQTPEYVVGDGEVTALASGHVVGRGRIGAADPRQPTRGTSTSRSTRAGAGTASAPASSTRP